MRPFLFRGLHAKLDELIAQSRKSGVLNRVLVAQGVKIMSLLQEMEAELFSINNTTTEIGESVANVAQDVDDLLEKLTAPGGLSQDEAEAAVVSLKEKSAALRSVGDQLKAVAAKWTAPGQAAPPSPESPTA